VENLGIVLLGLGLGLWARAHGDGPLCAIAFAGALLHAWNHAAMKGMLFLGAGSVVHATGTKDLERLGGLGARMPWTAATIVLGAVAIAALPPLNGLSGEWLLYRGLSAATLRADPTSALGGAAGVATMALVGGLAALCFVRVVGIALLGEPRSPGAAAAHESGPWMLAPCIVLAVACLGSALAPDSLVALHAPVAAALVGATDAGTAVARSMLEPLALADRALLLAIAVVGLGLARRIGRAARAPTWDCGYATPTPRMQYTARSFSELFAERVLPRWLRPRIALPRALGLFPSAAELGSDSTDPLTRKAYEPLLTRSGDRFARLRFLQQGSLHIYLVYILVTLVLGLAWVAGRSGWAP
jgi:NADH:ubiquinone oxidoreductase subunit 5 (subunit L)/multisubunit Na+/H+ antiporter MnhA subunit